MSRPPAVPRPGLLIHGLVWIAPLALWDWQPYDRFGHVMQGFVPAIVLRALLVR